MSILDLKNKKVLEKQHEEKHEYKETEIPANIKDRCDELRSVLVEKLAESDDVLMEKYLNDGVLELNELYTALRICTLSSKIFPVMGGDSRMADTKVLLDNVCRYLPSPYQKRYIF